MGQNVHPFSLLLYSFLVRFQQFPLVFCGLRVVFACLRKRPTSPTAGGRGEEPFEGPAWPRPKRSADGKGVWRCLGALSALGVEDKTIKPNEISGMISPDKCPSFFCNAFVST